MKHFLSLADLSGAEILALLGQAAALKQESRQSANRPILKGKSVALLFMKPSLRTRVSFEMATVELGGHAIYLSSQEVGIGERESIEDVGRILGRFVDIIVARVFGQDILERLADYSGLPVVNALSDFSHPCQGLADFMTIREKLGCLSGVRLAYLGDGNNVTNSLLLGGSQLGMHLAVATPPEYAPLPTVVARAKSFAAASGGSILLTTNPHEAVAHADVLYTDTWTSMGQEAERQIRLKVFPPYQINADLLALARPGALVMHCLPAHRGEEITDDIIEGAQSVVFDQAENRLHAQKAVLVNLASP
ncbi:MAG: ornithine carbamoyltransferase [Chloroflexi bacterium]|nr:ornithine carbamoyltransferase [Chloroflexota bacterium]